MNVEAVISALRVLERELPVTARTRQGWRASITPSTEDRKQVAEVHAKEASVVTVAFDGSGGADIDDAGFIIAETRIEEAVRTRVFSARRQGFAFNVPAGVTRLFCQGFAKPYTAFVQMAPGMTTTERVGASYRISAYSVNAYETPAFARLVTVVCMSQTVFVAGPGGTEVELTCPPGAPFVPQSFTMAAYGSISIRDAGFGSAFSLYWEVTS